MNFNDSISHFDYKDRNPTSVRGADENLNAITLERVALRIDRTLHLDEAMPDDGKRNAFGRRWEAKRSKHDVGYYHYGPSAVKLTQEISLPANLQAVVTAPAAGDVSLRLSGIFPEINRVWFTRDRILYMFNYHSKRDSTVHDSMPEAITCVGLVRAKPGFFKSDVKYVLVVATALRIRLILVTFSDGSVFGSLALHTTTIEMPTDNVLILSIVGTQTGRVFMAGRDSCVYEIDYGSNENRGIWSANKMRKVNRVVPWPVGMLVPSSIIPTKLYGTRAGPMVQMAVDNMRNLLFGLSLNGSIHAFSLGRDQDSFDYLLRDSDVVRRARDEFDYRNLEGHTVKFIFPTRGFDYRDLDLIAVTDHAARIYLKVVKAKRALSSAYELKIVWVRMGPPKIDETPDGVQREYLEPDLSAPHNQIGECLATDNTFLCSFRQQNFDDDRSAKRRGEFFVHMMPAEDARANMSETARTDAELKEDERRRSRNMPPLGEALRDYDQKTSERIAGVHDEGTGRIEHELRKRRTEDELFRRRIMESVRVEPVDEMKCDVPELFAAAARGGANGTDGNRGGGGSGTRVRARDLVQYGSQRAAISAIAEVPIMLRASDTSVAFSLFADQKRYPLDGLHEYAFHHVTPPREFVVLAGSTIRIYRRDRYMEHLRSSLETRDAEQLKFLFQRMGVEEACAACLVLACSSCETLDALQEVFPKGESSRLPPPRARKRNLLENGDMSTSSSGRRVSGHRRRRRDSFSDRNGSFLNTSAAHSLYVDGPGGGGGAPGDDFPPLDASHSSDMDAGGGGAPPGGGAFVRPDMSFAADAQQRRQAEEAETLRRVTSTANRSRRIPGSRITADRSSVSMLFDDPDVLDDAGSRPAPVVGALVPASSMLLSSTGASVGHVSKSGSQYLANAFRSSSELVPTHPLAQVQAHTVQAATDAFFNYGGKPKARKMKKASARGTRLDSNRMRDDGDEERQAYTVQFIESGKLQALFLYFSRMVRPVWNWSLFVPVRAEDTETIRQRWSSADLRAILGPITSFRDFLVKHQAVLLDSKAPLDDAGIAHRGGMLSVEAHHAVHNTQIMQERVLEKYEAERALQLLKFVGRTIELLELMLFVKRRSFPRVIAALPGALRTKLAARKFRDFVRSDDGERDVKEFIARFLQVEPAVMEKVAKYCPNFFMVTDRRACSAEKYLQESVKHYNNREIRDRLLIQAMELYEENARQLRHNFPLRFVCDMLREVHHYLGVLRLCLLVARIVSEGQTESHYDQGADEVVSPDTCFEVISMMFRELCVDKHLYKSASKELPLNDAARREIVQQLKYQAMNSNNARFHLYLFKYFLENNMDNELTSSVMARSPQLEPFLHERMPTNLKAAEVLIHFLVNGRRFGKAAQILLKWAHETRNEAADFTIEQRIERLAKAARYIRAADDGDVPEPLSAVEAKLQLAVLQREILLEARKLEDVVATRRAERRTHAQRDPRAYPARDQRKDEELSRRIQRVCAGDFDRMLKNAFELFQDARALRLWSIAIRLQDSGLVSSADMSAGQRVESPEELWALFIGSEIHKDRVNWRNTLNLIMQPLIDRLSKPLPLVRIVHQLELSNFRSDPDRPHSTFVAPLLLKCKKVNVDALISAYQQILAAWKESGSRTGSIDARWLNEGVAAQGLVFESALEVCRQKLKEMRNSGEFFSPIGQRLRHFLDEVIQIIPNELQVVIRKYRELANTCQRDGASASGERGGRFVYGSNLRESSFVRPTAPPQSRAAPTASSIWSHESGDPTKPGRRR